MTPLLVEATGVSRRFGRGEHATVALQPATFQISEGDRIALIGPSGSGKSTLLNVLAGLDEASDGTLTWPGIGDPQDLRPLSVGLIHQFASLVPTLSVAENVALPLCLGHVADGGETVLRALDDVGLRQLSERLPDELSGGQAQRAVIARTLAHAPVLLLADEPTGQLDSATRQTVLDAILGHQWATARAAIVIATHDPEVAARMKTVWHIEHGHLQTDLLASIQ